MRFLTSPRCPPSYVGFFIPPNNVLLVKCCGAGDWYTIVLMKPVACFHGRPPSSIFIHQPMGIWDIYDTPIIKPFWPSSTTGAHWAFLGIHHFHRAVVLSVSALAGRFTADASGDLMQCTYENEVCCSTVVWNCRRVVQHVTTVLLSDHLGENSRKKNPVVDDASSLHHQNLPINDTSLSDTQVYRKSSTKGTQFHKENAPKTRDGKPRLGGARGWVANPLRSIPILKNHHWVATFSDKPIDQPRHQGWGFENGSPPVHGLWVYPFSISSIYIYTYKII